MKKFIANAISLLLAVSVLAGLFCGINAFADTVVLPWSYSVVKADFSADTATPSAWGTNSSNKPTISTADEKLTATYVAVSGNEMTWEVKLGTAGKIAADDGGIGVDIDASALGYAPKFQIRVVDQATSGQPHKRIAADATVYLVAEDGTVTTATAVTYGNASKGAFVDIPAGFKGTVVFSLADLTEGTASNTVYEFADVTVRGVVIDTNTASTIVYDNIKYYTNTQPSSEDDNSDNNGGDNANDNPPAPVTLPWKYNTVKVDFSATSPTPSAWGTNSANKPSISTTGEKLTATYVAVSGNEMTWEVQLGEAGKIAADDGGIGIDVDASALTYAPKLQLRINDQATSGQPYKAAAADATVYLVAENGTVTAATTVTYGNASKGAFVDIPAGFKGTVVFSLADFTEGTATKSVYDFAQVAVRGLVIDTNTASTIVYDNIKYYTNTAPSSDSGNKDDGDTDTGNTPTVTTLPWTYNVVKADFSPTTAKPSCWGTSGSNKPTISTDNEILTASYVAVMGNEMTWEVKLGEKGVLAKTDGGFGIDVDASALNYAPKLQIRIVDETDASKSHKRMAVDADVYFIAADKTVTAVKAVIHDNPSKGAFVEIPAGFKGTVVFDLADFTDGTSKKSVYDIEDVAVRALIIDTQAASTIKFDNIAYYTNEKPAEPEKKVYNWGVRTVLDLTGFDEEIAKEHNKSTFGCWGGSPTAVKRTNFTMVNGRLKATYPKGDEFGMSFQPGNPVATDIGMAIYVDASALDYAHTMRLLISDEGVGYLQPTSGTVYYLIDTDGNVIEAPTDGSSCVTIPAGFKGTVAVEFASLTTGATDKVSIKEITNWAAVRFQLRVFGIKNDGDVVYYDNIGWMSTEVRGFPSTGEDTENFDMAVCVALTSVFALAVFALKKKLSA